MKIKKNILMLLALAFILPSAAFAGALTDYAENKINDHVFRGIAFSESAPSSYYVALYNTACSDAGAGTEVSGGGYARVAISRTETTWKGTHGSVTGGSSGTNGTISNASAVTFPIATSDWGTVGWWGIVDTATPGTGNLLVCAPLTSARNITTGSVPSYPVGGLTFQLDN